MKIRLNEIPQEGRTYTFNRETGELNAALEDTVADHAYDVSMHIKPIGNAYEMHGNVKTMVSEVCSLCGWDLEIPIDRKFHEILIEEKDVDHRKTKSVHGNHSLDFSSEGPAMTPVRGDVFDAAEFVHEAVALGEPDYPSCGDADCEHLVEANERLRALEVDWDEKANEKKGNPAFSVLKDLQTGGKNGRKN